VHRPGVELSIYRSLVRRPIGYHYTTEPPVLVFNPYVDTALLAESSDWLRMLFHGVCKHGPHLVQTQEGAECDCVDVQTRARSWTPDLHCSDISEEEEESADADELCRESCLIATNCRSELSCCLAYRHVVVMTAPCVVFNDIPSVFVTGLSSNSSGKLCEITFRPRFQVFGPHFHK